MTAPKIYALPVEIDFLSLLWICGGLHNITSEMGQVSFIRTRRRNKAVFACAVSVVVTLLRVAAGESSGVYRYNICNGLSNQLLYHAASIAKGKRQRKRIEIPDYFIVNGVQLTTANVVPNPFNSIPFGVAFDKDYFLEQLRELDIDAVFVTFDFSQEQIPCEGMSAFQKAEPRLTQKILEAFRPSEQLQRLIRSITDTLDKRGLDTGICVHHRNGQDWHDHCNRWGSISDGIYRGNCREVTGRTFVESLEDRGLTKSKWVYYCGDHDIPDELKPYTVLTKDRIMPEKDRKAVLALHSGDEIRDLWALIDFFSCRQFEHFIGNSVSTFSAIQIAIRDGIGAYWYNSQSIPLADFWKVYQMPIVYTYTELSASTGKHLLQSSIVSVRQQMPNNVIHMLYHGKEDTAFRQWLENKGVVVHNHNPSWRGKIEEMRLNGDPQTSHLFLHAGNYFGTWQRIDIPLFIKSEYCLLLDADTVIRKPFTFADFGLNLTYGISMSSEMYADDQSPSNAGVTLMNIPHLRQSYDRFLNFILSHVQTARFEHPSPSDQGAYLVFYQNKTKFLSRDFNFKPYWKLSEHDFHRVFIVHFHGPKPHDYMRYIMGKGCSKAVIDLCRASSSFPFLCRSLHYFARASRSVDAEAYCNASFDRANHVQYCGKIFEKLAKDGSECKEFSELAWQTLESMPSRMKLPREVIRKKLGIPISRTSRVGYVYFLWTLCWLAVATVLYRFLGRKQAIAISLFLWVIGSSMISYIMLLEQKGSKGLIGKFSR